MIASPFPVFPDGADVSPQDVDPSRALVQLPGVARRLLAQVAEGAMGEERLAQIAEIVKLIDRPTRQQIHEAFEPVPEGMIAPDTSPASVPIQLLVGTRYRAVSAGTRVGRGDTYPVFRVERDTMLVNPPALPFDVATETFTRAGIDYAFRSNSGCWARAGGTPPLLRQFDLGFVSATMGDVSSADVASRYDAGEALNVRLRLSIAPPSAGP